MIVMSFSVLFYQFSSTLLCQTTVSHCKLTTPPNHGQWALLKELSEWINLKRIWCFMGVVIMYLSATLSVPKLKTWPFWCSLNLPKNHCLKRENNSKGYPSYRTRLLHYPGHCKDSISLTEFSGSICIYNCSVKNWCQSTDLLCDLGSCSSTAGKFICLYFGRLVKYYTVPTRSEQTPFTVPVNPVSLQKHDSSVCSPATLLGWAETFKKAVLRQTFIQA